MKRFLHNTLLIPVSLLVFFILIEVSLAIFSPHKLRIRPYHETYDPIMGWINKPLKDEGIHFEFARDRFFHVKHNSHGLRGPETACEKPRGVKRILLVGDSYFWGYGVSDDEVLSAVLQKNLPATVEVLNGGTPGYGTDQEYLWLTNEGLKYRPDVVLFGFSAANDLQEVERSVSYYTPKPIFMLEGGNLVLKNMPVPRSEETDRKTFGQPRTLFGKVKSFLRFHTHTYPFVMDRLNSVNGIRRFLLGTGLAEEYTTNIGNVPLLTNPQDDVWAITLRLIKESRKAAESAGATFILVFIPEKEEDRSGRFRVDGVGEGAYASNSAVGDALAEFARREKIPYLDLLPFSRNQYERGEPVYTIDRSDHHWSAAGHRLIAAEVRRFLTQGGWIGR